MDRPNLFWFLLPMLVASAASAGQFQRVGAPTARQSHDHVGNCAVLLSAPPSLGNEISATHVRDDDPNRRLLDLSIDRLWREGGNSYATVRVRNNSSFSLVNVNVQCTVLGPEQTDLGACEQAVLATPQAPMPAGMTKTVTISVQKTDTYIPSISCNAAAL